MTGDQLAGTIVAVSIAVILIIVAIIGYYKSTKK